MGTKQSLPNMLYKHLKNNNDVEVRKLLEENKDLINEKICDKREQTPIIVCSMLNSYKCLKILLEYDPDLTYTYKGKNCYFIAAEKDNFYILKELIELKGLPNEEIEGMNLLDYSILNVSYRCSLYLHKTQNRKNLIFILMPIKEGKIGSIFHYIINL
jgi:ankyrin repeat protein